MSKHSKLQYIPEVPDREEVISQLRSILPEMANEQEDAIEDAIAYIMSTPVKVITGTGQRVCDCEKRKNVGPLPEGVAQESYDDVVNKDTLDLPSPAQLRTVDGLIKAANFDRLKKVQEQFPWMTKHKFRELIEELLII